MTTMLGVGLILPYYGAEAFGLHAIGDASVRYGASSLAEITDAVRYNPVAISLLAASWVVLAVGGVALARVLWTHAIRTGALLVGAGLTLYLPQFIGPPWVRIIHAAILGLGLVIVSVRLMRTSTHD